MKSSKHSERSSTYTRTAGIRQACDDVEAFQVVSSKLPHFFKQAPNPRCRHGLGEQGSERRVREKTFLPAKITRNLSICPRHQTTAPPDKNKPKKKKLHQYSFPTIIKFSFWQLCRLFAFYWVSFWEYRMVTLYWKLAQFVM